MKIKKNQNLFQRLRSNFLTGLVLITPIILTVYLLWGVINFIDDKVCRSGADLLLGFAAPRYDCWVPIFTICRLRDANFLLLFNGDGSVTVRLSETVMLALFDSVTPPVPESPVPEKSTTGSKLLPVIVIVIVSVSVAAVGVLSSVAVTV